MYLELTKYGLTFDSLGFSFHFHIVTLIATIIAIGILWIGKRINKK